MRLKGIVLLVGLLICSVAVSYAATPNVPAAPVIIAENHEMEPEHRFHMEAGPWHDVDPGHRYDVDLGQWYHIEPGHSYWDRDHDYRWVSDNIHEKNNVHGAEMTPTAMLVSAFLALGAYFVVRRYSHRRA